jgi:hypothetical protein
MARKRKSAQMVRIADDLYDQLRDLCAIHGVSIQAAVEYSVEEWIRVARLNHIVNIQTGEQTPYVRELQ